MTATTATVTDRTTTTAYSVNPQAALRDTVSHLEAALTIARTALGVSDLREAADVACPPDAYGQDAGVDTAAKVVPPMAALALPTVPAPKVKRARKGKAAEAAPTVAAVPATTPAPVAAKAAPAPPAAPPAPKGDSFELEAGAPLFREILGYLNVLVDEAKLTFGREEVSAKTVDPAHVAMVSVNLDRSAFGRLLVPTGHEIGIDVEAMLKIARLGKKGDTFTLRSGKGNVLDYAVAGISGSVTAIDTAGMTVPKQPKLNLPCRAMIPAKPVVAWLRDAAEKSDHLTVSADESGVRMVAENDTGRTELNIPAGKGEGKADIRLDGVKSVKSMFSLDYFSNIFRQTKGATGGEVSLMLGTNYPIVISWEFAGEAGGVEYLLAPRIENE